MKRCHPSNSVRNRIIASSHRLIASSLLPPVRMVVAMATRCTSLLTMLSLMDGGLSQLKIMLIVMQPAQSAPLLRARAHHCALSTRSAHARSPHASRQQRAERRALTAGHRRVQVCCLRHASDAPLCARAPRALATLRSRVSAARACATRCHLPPPTAHASLSHTAIFRTYGPTGPPLIAAPRGQQRQPLENRTKVRLLTIRHDHADDARARQGGTLPRPATPTPSSARPPATPLPTPHPSRLAPSRRSPLAPRSLPLTARLPRRRCVALMARCTPRCMGCSTSLRGSPCRCRGGLTCSRADIAPFQLRLDSRHAEHKQRIAL